MDYNNISAATATSAKSDGFRWDASSCWTNLGMHTLRPYMVLLLITASGILSLMTGTAFAVEQTEEETTASSSGTPESLGDRFTWNKDDFTLKLHLSLSILGGAMDHPFFNFAKVTSPDNAHTYTSWFEYWASPGLEGTLKLPESELYGTVSVAFGGTGGRDAYNIENTATFGLNEGYLGFRTLHPDDELNIDIKAGRFINVFDTGMLLGNGTVNGGERGLSASQQWRAWDYGVLAEVSWEEFALQGYYVAQNGLPDETDTEDKFAGITLSYDRKALSLSAGYIRCIHSLAPYPTVAGPETIIVNGRDELNIATATAEIRGAISKDVDAFLRAEAAYEWKDSIDMRAWATSVRAGLTLKTWPLYPRMYIDYTHYSGDDPETSRYERFDPVWWTGGQDFAYDGYWIGINGTAMFYPANDNAVRANLDLLLTPKDSLKFQYIHYWADEKNSPISFGQAARISYNADGSTTLVPGVPEEPLGDEIWLAYIHQFTPELTGILLGAFTVPGSGVKAIAQGKEEDWFTLYAVLNFRF